MAKDDLDGVQTPPPVVYLALMLFGVGLQFRWPIPFLAPGTQYAIGFTVIVLSIVLFGLVLRTFLASKTSLDHRRPTTALIRSGPFRYSRNPIYVSMTMLGLGAGALLNNFWIVLAMVPAVFVIRYFVIAKEEALLEKKFGDEYLRYKASVRRWI